MIPGGLGRDSRGIPESPGGVGLGLSWVPDRLHAATTVNHIAHRGLARKRLVVHHPLPSYRIHHPGGGKGLARFTRVAWDVRLALSWAPVAAARGFCVCTVPRWNRTESRLLFPFETKAGEGGNPCCVTIHAHGGLHYSGVLCGDVDGCGRLLVL